MTLPAGPEEVRARIVEPGDPLYAAVEAFWTEHNTLARAYVALQARQVPREPTDKMIECAQMLNPMYSLTGCYTMGRELWRAMWDAASSRLAKLEQERGRGGR